jgi:TP901 family phage tail tape measure protein
MAEAPLSIRDFINADDTTPIDKMIKMLGNLEGGFTQISNHLEKESQRAKASLQVWADGLAQVEKAVKAAKSGPAAEAEIKGAATLIADIEKMKKATEGYEKQISSLKDTIGKLQDAQKKLPAPDRYKPELNSLADLKKRMNEAKKEYESFGNSNSDGAKAALKSYTELSQKVKVASVALTDAKKAVVESNGSYHALAREVQRLNADLKNMPNAFDKTNKAAAALKREIFEKTQALKEFDKSVNQSYRNVGNYADALRGAGDMLKNALNIASYAAFFGAIVGGFRSLIATNKDFEKSLSSLSSITGAVGEDLQFYNRAAKEIGATTTLSASQAVEAFKLMGSAAPELLKNRDALVATTKEAVTLAEAAGIELPEATQALASAMAQFNLPATEAARIINVLAAGSKVGAAEIPDLAASLDKAGLSAKNAGVSLEETTAAVEVLSKANLKGAEAGTSLKNVLLTMSTIKALPEKAQKELAAFGVDLDKVSDSTLPFNERLQELSKISGDATAMVKVFGKENVNAGGALLQNIALFEEFTDGVTGTATAMEQAAINVDNLDGDLKTFSSVLESIVLEGSLLNNVFRGIVKGATEFLLTLKEVPKFLNENKEAIGLLALGVISLNKALVISAYSSLADAAAKAKQIIVTKAAAIAQWRLNAALTANPIGIVVAAVALLVAGFITLYNRSEAVRGAIAGLAEAAKGTFVSMAENAVAILGGIGDLLLGVFTLDIDKIKSGFSASMAAIKKVGADTAAGYRKGYNDQLAKERKKELKEEEAHSGSVAGFVTEIEEHKREEIEKTAKAAKEARKAAEEEYKKLLEIEKGRVSSIEKNNARIIKAEQDLVQARLKEQIALADKEANNGNGDRLGAVKERLKLEKELAQQIAQVKIEEGKRQLDQLDRQLAEELEKVKGNKKLEEAVRMSFIDQRLSLEKTLAKESETINEGLQTQLREIERKGLEDRKKIRLEDAQEKLAESVQRESIELLKAFNEGRISQKQFYFEMAALQDKLSQQRIENLRRELGETKEVRDAELEYEKKKLEERADALRKHEQDMTAIKQQAKQEALNLVDDLFTLTQTKRENEIQSLEDQKNREVELEANNSLAKELLAKKFDAKIAALRKKQAESEKRQKIFSAVTSGLQGVAQAVARVELFPFNFVLAGLIAAQTGAQVANIRATPIPAFAKGTKNAPEGLAFVDERGAEIIEKKDGTMYLGTDKGARLTYLEKGDKVHTATQTKSILKENETFLSVTHRANLFNTDEVQRLQGDVTTRFIAPRNELLEGMAKPMSAQSISQLFELNQGQVVGQLKKLNSKMKGNKPAPIIIQTQPDNSYWRSKYGR